MNDIRTASNRLASSRWYEPVAEVGIIAASLLAVVTQRLGLLIGWEVLASLYLAVGLVLSWRSSSAQLAGDPTVRRPRRHRGWNWVLPLTSSLAGANSAVVAIISKADASQDLQSAVYAIVASCGVVLSWALLQVGFAHIYQEVDSTPDDPAIDFPGADRPSSMNYLYFSFVIGTSFATSDSSVRSIRVRRVVLIHSILSFFYNALVVAVAIQVLQQLISAT